MRRMLLIVIAAICAIAQTADPDKALKDALARHQRGDLEGAIQGYRIYLAARPNAAEIRSNLGAALVRAGQVEAGIAEYKRALDQMPRNFGVRLNLALAYYKSGSLQEAVEELVTVHAAQPENRQVVVLLGDCYLRMGLNRKVIDLLAPLETRGEDDLPVDYLLGSALIRDRQPAHGQILIDKILRVGDSAQARILMGSAKRMAHDYVGAVADLARAIELDPTLPGVYSYYGMALLDTADSPAAANAFRKELESNPFDYLANLELGILSKQEQQHTAAMAYLRRALQVRPWDLATRYQIATVNFALGKPDEARAELERVAAEAPDFIEAHVSLATAYYRLKRKADGDRERAIVQKLNAERQAKDSKDWKPADTKTP